MIIDKTYEDLKSNVYPLNNAPIEIEIGKMSDVKETKIHWLWRNVVAYGKMTILAGEPGIGKSSLLFYIASIVSQGNKFHYQSENCDKSPVLIISAEDSAEDTIKPRLMALNADLDNIHFVKGIKKLDKKNNPFYDPICLIENLSELEDKIVENKYKLIVVDPITAYLGTIDDSKNKDIRSALAKLQALCERHNLAIILNNHFTKPQKSNNHAAIYRIMGSVGFAAAPRIVFGVFRDPDDESGERRYFKCIKNNIGDDRTGYVYKMKGIILNGEIETSCIDWIDEKVEMSANEILNYQIKAPRLEEAKEFLKEKLKFGSVPLTEIREEFKKRSFSVDIMYKAKKSLNVQDGGSFGHKRGIIWYF